MDIRASESVRRYYPDALKSSWFITAFLAYMKHALKIGEKQIAFLTSICSDDLNSVEWPRTGMVGPFVQGGLDGYPFAGKTGIGAFSHHIPDDGGALLLYGPHVGITQSGLVGQVVRPGQSKPTTCCGAAAAALGKLEQDQIRPKLPSQFAEDDYQQEKLEQLLLAHKNAILAAGSQGGPERFIEMSEAIRKEQHQAMASLLTHVDFEHPTFLFGCILINEDAGHESSIALRAAGRIDHGKYEDLTEPFKKYAEPRFKELQSGKADAFK